MEFEARLGRPKAVRVLSSGLVPGLLLVFLAGCGMYSTATLEVGDPQYPQVNPRAKQVIPLVVTGLDYAKVKFRSHYSTDRAICGREVGLGGGYFPLSVSTPIALSPIQASHRGIIVIDQFLPGACNWTFGGVTYETAGEGGLGVVENSLLITYQTPSIPNFSAMPHLDFWCYQRIPVRFGTLSQPRCEPPSMILWPNATRRVTTAFRSRLSSEEQKDVGERLITAETQEVTVTLHNLEVEPGAMDSPRADGT